MECPQRTASRGVTLSMQSVARRWFAQMLSARADRVLRSAGLHGATRGSRAATLGSSLVTDRRLRLDSPIYVAGHRGLVGSAVWRHLQVQGFLNLLGAVLERGRPPRPG